MLAPPLRDAVHRLWIPSLLPKPVVAQASLFGTQGEMKNTGEKEAETEHPITAW